MTIMNDDDDDGDDGYERWDMNAEWMNEWMYGSGCTPIAPYFDLLLKEIEKRKNPLWSI